MAKNMLYASMDPIVASSLVSVGKNLFDKFTSLNPNLPQPQSTSFSEELNGITATQNDFSRKELQENFPVTGNPILSEKDAGDTLYLEPRADGSMQILSSSGRTLILKEGSEACSTAKKLFQSCLKEQIQLSDNRINAVEIKV